MAFWQDSEPESGAAAAEWYVRQRRWAVTPGTHVTDGRCSCAASGCDAPGAHPALGSWRSRSTTDAEVVRRWWGLQPNASIVLPTGLVFDVLDVPAQPGLHGLHQLELAGYHIGPAALTAQDRLLIWVATGASVLTTLMAAKDWPYQGLDIRCHTGGGYVVVPPSRGTAWIIPPNRCWCLPSAVEIVSTLALASIQAQGRDQAAATDAGSAGTTDVDDNTGRAAPANVSRNSMMGEGIASPFMSASIRELA